jgi:predicted nuclease with RNAse H fold
MRTLGIDLASAAERTALCVLEWRREGASVTDLRVGVTDDAILQAHDQADATGIDCPFGWPERFRKMLAEGVATQSWSKDLRDSLRFRLTDELVRDAIKRWPLSVSSDLIAVPAMRCQLLLLRLGVTDRSGDGSVFEVYPAASLARWGFTSRGYKRRDGLPTLQGLVSAFRERLPWLDLGDWQGLLTESDDAFDALVAALTAYAARRGLTVKPAPNQQPIAAREGWIALPEEGSLGRLVDRGAPGPA